MKLKNISLLMVVLAAAVVACSSTESAVSSRRMSAGQFSTVVVSGSLPVELRQVPDSAGQVVVMASDRAMADVRVACTGGTLAISYESEPGTTGYSREVKRVVAYCGREVQQLRLTGSGMLSSKGLRTASDLTVVLTGSGMMNLDDVVCANFTGSLTGSGMLNAKGLKARNVSISGTGSGMVNAKDVDAVSFNCTESGSGMVNAAGTATKASLALRGSGMVNAKGMRTHSVSVSCSGSGMVNYDSSAPEVKVVSGRQTSKGTVTR